MKDYQFHYMFALPDLETFDLEYNNVNISAFRLVDAGHPATKNLLKDMEKFQPIGQSILNKTNIIQVPDLLLIHTVAVAINRFLSL